MKLRRFFGLLLALCVLLAIGVPAMAAEPTHFERTVVNPRYANEITAAEVHAACEQIRADAPAQTLETKSFTSMTAASDYMRGQLAARTEEVCFWLKTSQAQDFELTTDELIDTAIAHTGVPDEGDYLAFQYGGCEISGTGYSDREYCYTFVFRYYTTASQEAAVTKKLNQIMPAIRSAGGPYARLEAIYDYICAHVTYDYAHLEDSDYHLKATAYAALLNGTAVCQGYANLFYRMALEAGVDARIMDSRSLNHAWNIARLGTKYYELDATWDAVRDPYAYFLRGSSDFEGHDNSDDPIARSSAFAKKYPLAETRFVSGTGPTITTQPTSYTGAAGDQVTFTVKASGSNLTYQWQYSDDGKTWVDSSSKTATATANLTSARSGRQYRCIVTNGAGNSTISSAAKMTVSSTLAITTQPKAASVKTSAYATFTVKATGSGLKYQWQYLKPNGSWTNCTSKTEGYNKATLKVQGVTDSTNRNGWKYRCKVTNSAGKSVTSNAATLNVLAIKTQPKAASVKTSAYATFTVKATGSGLKYQWQYLKPNGSWTNCTSKTQGYNTATLKVQGVTDSTNRNGWKYRCKVTDSAGNTITTNAVKLNVLAVTTQPKAASVSKTGTATFTVKATGSSLKYQWQYLKPNGSWTNCTSKTTGYNKATLKVEGATGSTNRNGWKYRCVITDAAGNKLTTSAVKLTVK